MSVKTSYTIALKALRRNKLQTGLTMLGMTIGVATVLTMVGLGNGAQTAIQDQVRAAGMNLIVVTAGNYQVQVEKAAADAIEPAAYEPAPMPQAPVLKQIAWDSSQRAHFLLAGHPEDDPFAVHNHPTSRQRLGDSEAGLGAAATLTNDDANEIRKIKGVQYVSEGIHENVHVVAGDKRWYTRVHGDDSSLPLIRRAWVFPWGRFFNKKEVSSAKQVCVLGYVTSQRLFGDASPIGKEVTLWKQTFEVVGVVGSSSWLVAPEPGDDQFDAIYIPISTMQKLLNLSKLNDITLTTLSTGDVTRVSKTVTDLLRKRHNISAKAPDDFTVTNQARKELSKGSMRPEIAQAVVGNIDGLEKVTLGQLSKTLDRSSQTMSVLLGSIATVSLIVGGIGIMNIMLLSVTERTREIGIRRAVGATSSDVLMQFVIESITLSVVGGLLGIVIGFIVAAAISHSVQWSTSISPLSVIATFLISAAIGIFFGWYPARQASRVPPIASLRFE
ncbi:FtsX-like permease family protein [Granulicella sp. WH15]|uniref:ABC transporter permease n=1 Tax=Granulicella sp. WH15 TaxID=2602070 RepID=UPI001366C9B4|nr:ABC transporter permease [Granulicella sp. WH15]QHN04516.1 FtsX-like permease family protein [Granulicella sp. WH15]